ncbi:thiol-disulfide oxidoreductase DCC family protein [Catenovulum adriaticum]|uniref:DCC1-like thiol-disulfide oxidoreductase family protein n=1 Tax=Catenovulum adriaticum TaxID=2984846 RepID=A0ABY7AP81_9ALTE|nr:DCC1-like thiol-disulfide oxidoreductase family protein [Catenovulum sp. TS8]WAJ71377.1 DCC1-like thiol-disulfide oxidoreductase family protein [Catenovulum sp. TS8]
MDNHYIIIFDGVCNFCHGAVNFIIKRDYANQFVFAPMQSPAAQRLMAEYKLADAGCDSFILIKKGHCYLRTHAAIEVTKDLSGAWYLLSVFKVVPAVIRDYFYRLLASNRYKWFGKKDRCLMPDEKLDSKFLWSEASLYKL